MKNDRFGNFARGMINAVAAFENKQATAIEAEIGELVSVAATTVQGYKQGRVPETHRVIEVLAEFGVRRAYLNRIWLQRLLDAVQYYDTARLIDRLCPTVDTPPRPPRARDNLPAPTYSSFIMRPDAYAQVIEGLRQRSALVAIISMGGMGKTSLALEVAKRCLEQPAGLATDQGPASSFDSAVWVSDKDQPGTTTLATVLDTIALTLNYPGLTRLDLREKLYEVGQLLRRQRVLLIIDNYETITDKTLLDWLLLSLPEPSKAVLTSRVYRREFQRGSWIVELDGMAEVEAEQLIGQVERQLSLGKVSQELTRQLWAVTGGNPKALEMTLGYAKYARLPLAHIVEDLGQTGQELFAELFGRSWGMLDRVARQTLAAATLFPSSASAPALMRVTGSDDATFDLATRRLVDLGLLDVIDPNNELPGAERRFALHPLTRTFMLSKEAELRDWVREARDHWVAWGSELAQRYGGFAIDDLSRLGHLDADEVNLFAVVAWTVHERRYPQAIALIRNLEFYYYVRALWSKKLELHHWYVEAASQTGNADEAINALALHIQLLSHQDRLDEAASYLQQLQAHADQHPLTGVSLFNYFHTLGLYRLAQGSAATARICWERLLAAEGELASHMVIGVHHWLARCAYAERDQEQARRHFAAALEAARARRFDRLVGRNQLWLALLDIDEGNLDQAEERMEEAQHCTRSDDWEQHARLAWALARIALRRGIVTNAREQYARASALFERMGLVREVREIGGEAAAIDPPDMPD